MSGETGSLPEAEPPDAAFYRIGRASSADASPICPSCRGGSNSRSKSGGGY